MTITASLSMTGRRASYSTRGPLIRERYATDSTISARSTCVCTNRVVESTIEQIYAFTMPIIASHLQNESRRGLDWQHLGLKGVCIILVLCRGRDFSRPISYTEKCLQKDSQPGVTRFTNQLRNPTRPNFDLTTS